MMSDNLFVLYRVKNGIKQDELAKLIGVGQSTVSMWETGERLPSLKLLPKLKDIMGDHFDLEKIITSKKLQQQSTNNQESQ